MKFRLKIVKLFICCILMAGFSFSQKNDKLNTRYSEFIYNDWNDTIHLSEIGEIDYVYCYSRDDSVHRANFYGFWLGPLIERQSEDTQAMFFDGGNTIRCDSLSIIDSIQIDNTGSKELVFFRHFNGTWQHVTQSSSRHDKYELTKIEIWNIDTKKMVFEKVIHYRKDFSVSSFYSHSSTGTKEYNLKFQIDPFGVITIHDEKGLLSTTEQFSGNVYYPPFTPTEDKLGYSKDDTQYDICPEWKMVRYEFIDGAYRLVE